MQTKCLCSRAPPGTTYQLITNLAWDRNSHVSPKGKILCTQQEIEPWSCQLNVDNFTTAPSPGLQFYWISRTWFSVRNVCIMTQYCLQIPGVPGNCYICSPPMERRAPSFRFAKELMTKIAMCNSASLDATHARDIPKHRQVSSLTRDLVKLPRI